MKRIIISCIMLVLLVGTSIYSMNRVSKANNVMNEKIDIILASIDSEDAKTVEAETEGLRDYWIESEKRLSHFIRHSSIDVVTDKISRLPALAKYEEYGELAAELAAIKQTMRHILATERLELDE